MFFEPQTASRIFSQREGYRYDLSAIWGVLTGGLEHVRSGGEEGRCTDLFPYIFAHSFFAHLRLRVTDAINSPSIQVERKVVVQSCFPQCFQKTKHRFQKTKINLFLFFDHSNTF